MMNIAAYGIGLEVGYLRVIAVLSTGLLVLAIRSLVRPSERINFGLFGYASLYVLGTMLLAVLGPLGESIGNPMKEDVTRWIASFSC